MNNFLKRLITAVVLIAWWIVFIVFLPYAVFGLMVALFIAWAATEWAFLLNLLKWQVVGYVMCILGVLTAMYFLPMVGFWCLSVAVLCWLLAAVSVCSKAAGHSAFVFEYRWVSVLAGIFMLSGAWLSIMLLRDIMGGKIWLLLGLTLVCLTDTGAYVGGKLWGKQLLAPRLSPKKTWEGMWVGVSAAVIVSFLFGMYFYGLGHYGWLKWLFLGLITAFSAVLGDLFESFLKRRAGKKDSGYLLMGHGGLLDRIDSSLSGLLAFTVSIWFLFFNNIFVKF